LSWVELSWVDKCMNRISDPAVHFHLDGQWILGSRFSWLHGNAIKGWNDMIPCLWPWSSALDLGPGWHSHSLIRFAFFPLRFPHPASRILHPASCILHPALSLTHRHWHWNWLWPWAVNCITMEPGCGAGFFPNTIIDQPLSYLAFGLTRGPYFPNPSFQVGANKPRFIAVTSPCLQPGIHLLSSISFK